MRSCTSAGYGTCKTASEASALWRPSGSTICYLADALGATVHASSTPTFRDRRCPFPCSSRWRSHIWSTAAWRTSMHAPRVHAARQPTNATTTPMSENEPTCLLLP